MSEDQETPTPTPISEEEEQLKMELELNKENEILRRQVEELKSQQHELEKDYENAKSYQETRNKELSDLKFLLSEIGNKIDSAKKNNKSLNVDEIRESCKRVINRFITTTDGVGEKILLTVKVQYQNMVFIKMIEDDAMDFGRMKHDLITQLDMRQNDFYFLDVNNCILIDELNVKRTLFPFSMSKVEKYEPSIKVVEAGRERKLLEELRQVGPNQQSNHVNETGMETRNEATESNKNLLLIPGGSSKYKDLKEKEIDIDIDLEDLKKLDVIESQGSDESSDDSNMSSKEVKKKKKHSECFNLFWGFLKKHGIEIANLTTFIIFILLWINSCIDFRKISFFNIMSLQFRNLFDSKFISTTSLTQYNLLDKLKTGLANTLQMPLYSPGFIKGINKVIYDNFNSQNLDMGYIRLTQTRSLIQNCSESRVNFTASSDFKNCRGSASKVAFTSGSFNYTYKTEKYYSKPFIGVFEDYDNSGFQKDVQTLYEYFNQTMDSLISSKWIDSHTNSLLLQMMFYNINLNVFFMIRICFENLGVYFQPSVDYGLIGLDESNPSITWIALLFSIANLFFVIMSLRHPSKQRSKFKKPLTEEKTRKQMEILNSGDGKMNMIKQVRMFFIAMHYSFKKNFKKPNFFQALIITSHVLLYFLLIARFDYYAIVSAVHLDELKFNDFSEYNTAYDVISYLNAGLILLFMFAVVNHMSYWVKDFNQIANSLQTYMYELLSYFFTFTIIFMLISQYIAYKTFGDFFNQSYKNFSFTIIRLFGAFFKGSIDDDEYISGSRRVTSESSFFPNSLIFNRDIQNSFSPFLAVTYHASYGIYCIFSFIYYFVSNYLVRIVFVGIFLKIYKKNEVEQREAEDKRLKELEREKEKEQNQ